MKKLFFVLAVLVLSATAFAQGNINRGNILIGGQAGFSSSKYSKFDDFKWTSVEISPNFGYFFANQFAGGLRVNFESTKYEDEDASSTTLISPFIRYYFLPPANKANVFFDASYGFGSMKDGESESINGFSLMAGPAIFLSPSAALEFGIGYTSLGGDAFGGDGNRLNSFGLKIGFQIHLGGSGSR